jgi:hypothetical protein
MWRKWSISSMCAIALAVAATVAWSAGAHPGYRSTSAEIERELRVPNRAARSGSCGVERWSIKTGTDGGARKVDIAHPVPATIEFLRSLQPPARTPNTSRVAPAESTAYVLDATLSRYRMEGDSDYRLVLRDARGNTVVAEIPDPACVPAASPFAPAIRRARAAFDARFATTSRNKSANVSVRVTGIGFFDARNDLAGVAPNGIELHPLLDIAFEAAGSPRNP